jgi:aspartyl-tRNA(Asn)/glutamyl-tRNA(Gln) amidotransferase subunit A
MSSSLAATIEVALVAAGLDPAGLDLEKLADVKAETEQVIARHRADEGYDGAVPAFNPPAYAAVETAAPIETAGADVTAATKRARAAVAAIKASPDTLNTFIALADAPTPESSRSSDQLLGLTFSLKDNIDAIGFQTTCGSRALADAPPATTDSWIAAALKGAGAQLIGKNNMHEFALGISGANKLFGRTSNPWDVGRTCGGSSGGSASAVAQRQVDVSVGTDSGGSVRTPASFTGVVGFKPTAGVLPMSGVAGAAWTIDCLGLFTQDMATMRRAWSALVPGAALERKTAPHFGYLADDSMGPVDPVVWASYLDAIERLRAAGATMTPISIHGLNDGPYVCMSVVYPEIVSLQYELMRSRPELYDQDIRGLVCLGELWSSRNYLDAQRVRQVMRRRFADILEPFDAVLTPSVAVQAPRHGEDPRVAGDQSGKGLYTAMRFSVAFNCIGYPGISVPSGLDADGLPTGLQLIGRPGQDAALLELAQHTENILGRLAAPGISIANI